MNNFPIGNGLTTGYYKVYDYTTNVQIASVPASNWPYNGIQTFQICNSFSGSSLNLAVTHYGAGINSGIRQHRLYLSTYQAVVDAGADANICQGAAVQLVGTGSDTYSWSPASGLSQPMSNDFVPSDWFETPSGYHQWSGGIVATTPPVSPQGWNFVTIDKADEFCVRTFGAGWRVTEFHDGAA